MKEVRFVGRALAELREFPLDAKHDSGSELQRVQRGLDPVDWKPKSAIDLGKKRLKAAGDDAAQRKGEQP